MAEPLPKVLVIETDQASVRAVRRALRGCHAVVSGVRSLDSGLKRLRREAVDVVLLSVDGVADSAVHEAVRAAAGAPVIAIGEQETKVATARAIRIGAQDYVVRANLGISDIERAIRYASVRKSSEEKFRALVENLNDVIHCLDVEGRVTYLSPSAEKIFGCPTTRLVGKRIDSLVFAEDRLTLWAMVQNAIEGRESVGMFRVADAERRLRWLRVSYRPVTTEGRITGLNGVLTDVTDRRRAADALQRSYDLVDETQRLAKMGGWQMDLGSGRVLWSEGMFRLYGVGQTYDPCDMGKNFSFFVPEAIPTMARAFRDVLEHGTPYDLNLEFIRANGDRIWVRTLGEPVLRRGKIVGVSGYLMDVTEPVLAQKVILDADAKRKAILDNVKLGIALVGTDMRIREFSAHLGEWFPEVKSKDCGPCYSTLRRPPRQGPCDDCPMLASGSGAKGCEAGFVASRDGATRQYRATVSAVRDAAGAVVGAVEIIEDATERLALEERLRHQQKLESIGTLAGGVAHEVNNPINGIMGYAQLMVDGAKRDSEVDQFGREIIHECERVTAIVRDLLSFARQDSEEQTPAQIGEMLRSALALIRALMRRDGITLDVGETVDLPTIRCRKGPVRQVLMNLLTNARDAVNTKYQPGHPDKVIRVRTGLLNEDGRMWLRTTVEDHGVGIAPGIRERIFDPFFTTKPRDQGTGLGLSVSYGIVKEHGGRLDFESEPGQWTRFHLDLPVPPDSGS